MNLLNNVFIVCNFSLQLYLRPIRREITHKTIQYSLTNLINSFIHSWIQNSTNLIQSSSNSKRFQNMQRQFKQQRFKWCGARFGINHFVRIPDGQAAFCNCDGIFASNFQNGVDL